MKYEVKFIKKPFNISIEKWEADLNIEGKRGWKVIQLFSAPDGNLTALLRKQI